MSNDYKILDLSFKSFDEFVEFFFNRDVVPDDRQFDYYLTDPAGEHYEDAVASSAEIIVGHLTKLFSSFGHLAPKYSLEQLDQGIWGMFGERLRLYEHLWDLTVPIEQRRECISSMFFVYSDFVAKSNIEVMPCCFDMWWDLILHGFWWQQKFFDQNIKTGEVSKLDMQERILLDAMFETLKKILTLEDPRTQNFALHGLGHLHHSGVPGTVQAYLDTHNTDLTDAGRQWVEQCRDGKVM